MTPTLYDNIVTVLTAYLGPAAPRFVDRQIESHLKKPPIEVMSSDVPQLAEWIRVSLALLTDDVATIEECTRRLLQLT